MRSIFLIMKQELRVVLADKKALALLFLMPSLLIVFLSLAMKDIYLQKVGQNLEVTFLFEQTNLSDQIVNQFEAFEYKVQKVHEFENIQTYIERSDEAIVIEFPENIGDLLKGKSNGHQIKMYFDPSLDKAYSELVKSHLLISMQSMVIDQVNKKLKSQDQQNNSENDAKKIEINQLALAKDIVEEVGQKEIIPNPIQQTVPGWTLFAMFFIALPMAGSFIRDRKNAVLKRLLCYNVSKSSLLIGKIAPYLLINNIQFYLMMLLGLYALPQLMSASYSVGPLKAEIFVITFVCSLAATSYGLLVASLAKTYEQAASFGALLVVIMALFGGVMIPSFVMPEFMQKVAAISPLYWGLESYLDLFLRGMSLTEIGLRMAVLLIFSVIAFMVSLTQFRWSE